MVGRGSFRAARDSATCTGNFPAITILLHFIPVRFASAAHRSASRAQSCARCPSKLAKLMLQQRPESFPGAGSVHAKDGRLAQGPETTGGRGLFRGQYVLET